MCRIRIDFLSTVLKWLVLVAISLQYNIAIGDQYHYTNILVGSRAAGLGGAYTAISDDPAGLYYNPAGIVYSDGANFSGNMNALHNATIKYQDVLGGEGWIRESSTLPPNYFGVLQPFGKSTIGFSIAVPDSTLENQDQTFRNFPSSIPGVNVSEFDINFNNQDNTYKIGPSVAYKLNKRLSIGTTLYLHYRDVERIQNQVITFDNNTFNWLNNYFHNTEYGVTPIFGIMWSPMKKIAIGASTRYTFLFSSLTESQFTCSGCEPHPFIRQVEKSDMKAQFPINISVGAAYFWSHALLFSEDFNYFSATDDGNVATWNLALGSEYYFNPNWAGRIGIFTNNANSPDLVLGQFNQEDNVDLFGGSLSISHFTRNSALSFGMSYAYGSGLTQLFSDSERIQNVNISLLTFFVSSTVSY